MFFPFQEEFMGLAALWRLLLASAGAVSIADCLK
jgi:hypothetical protein